MPHALLGGHVGRLSKLTTMRDAMAVAGRWRVSIGQRDPWRLWKLALAVLLTSYVTVSCALFVFPAGTTLQRVNAVVTLDGPDEAARRQVAVSLVERHIANTLVFSQGAYHSAPCPRVPTVDVICFTPTPARTVGEVEFATRLARLRHWTSLLVVTGHEQATRVRLLMRRCYRGRLLVDPAPLRLSSLAFQVIYETGALIKALVWDRTC